MKLVVHAPNVHVGGGKTLLRAALLGVDATLPCTVLADSRLGSIDGPPSLVVETFSPTFAGRLRAERRLQSIAHVGDVVLCMGNLPPLFSCPARVSVFLQNRYLCEDLPVDGFSRWARGRIGVERIWLRRRLRADTRVLVQTASMQRAVRRSLSIEAVVLPFAELSAGTGIGARPTGRPRFLYPASGEAHKNHPTLLSAWRRLQHSGIDAELHLTVDPASPLGAEIARAREGGLPVVNHGQVEPARLAEIYRLSTALIFPSRSESFGLPLLEAQAAGLPIVAAELDYVRDVVRPIETFDPDSDVSIARAVMRFLGTPEQPPALLTPADFIRRVLSGGA